MRFLKKRKIKPTPKLGKGLSEYTEDFQEFWANFVQQPMGLIRKEVDTSFLTKIRGEEKSVMLDYLRSTLNEKDKQVHTVEAIGELKEENSIEPLSKMLGEQTKIGWKIPISRALNQINGDKRYFEVLAELAASDDLEKKSFYQHHLLDLKNASAIRALISLLIELPKSQQRRTLILLNWLKTGVTYPILDDDLPYSAEYFIERKDNEDFLAGLSRAVS